ncbi:hypothetical protein GGS23DRAFT_557591 [Durotheca rogersii]|uniref:uncharacterized protein n=1 Tax=Durotheca rogersii TaxID=419775 RepID=UPI00222119C0|nr:uncharacterized protein GGS23DRAFT_557591 [Durotheca rogersii]KAI5865081.1 hypothetical protein GGS23DRAFT_557591 [Durotheca rogersii]
MRGLRPGFVTYDAAGAEVAAPHGEGPAKRQPETKTLRPPAGANVALFEEFFAGLAAMGQKWNSSDKLILSVICTDPAYHGRGIAAAMIRSVLAVADAEGVPAYLEALPLAAPLYRRLGFADVDRLECDLAKAGRQGKAVLTVMVREPGAGDV